jgi:hypothetical protein
MSLAAVQEEVETWPPEDQDRLATHLALLRLKRSGHIEEMSRRLDDDQPGAWLPFAEIKRKLGRALD